MEECLCRGHKHLVMGKRRWGADNVNVWVRMRMTAGVVSLGSVCMFACVYF